MIRPQLPWVEEYMKIPFKKDGMTRDGLNCYGLVRIIMLDRCGIEIPAFEEISSHELALVEGTINEGKNHTRWVPVDVGLEKIYDVGVFKELCVVDKKIRAMAIHVGIVVAPGWVLHAKEELGIVMQSYQDKAGMRKTVGKLQGFYRHRALL